MKNLLLTICLLSNSFALFGQSEEKGILFEVGTGYFQLNSEFANLSGEITQFYHVKLESTSMDNFLGAVEYDRSIGDKILSDLRIKGGILLNSSGRLQFPLLVNLSFYSYEDNNLKKMGSVGGGISGGLRFYMTNKISFNLTAAYNSYGINTIGDDKYDKSQGAIANRSLTASLGYFF